jgi:hypothetical protein
MTLKFKATYYHSETNHEEGIHILGLSNGEYEYDSYVLFQRAIEFDEQDIALGMNAYHFEVNGQENSEYGACKKITLDMNKLNISIDPVKIHDLDIVEIDISSLTLDSSFLDNFRQILKDEADFRILD